MNGSEKLYPVVTVPLAPYIKPGLTEPIKTKRLRPIDALNIPELTKELDANTVTTIDIDGNPWSIVAVFSPYSVDMHVMLMETGNRYVPGPEVIEEHEGVQLMQLWADIVKFFKKRKEDNRVFIGYNWSPRSWGDEEEKGGFQSIPTKWHPMFWNWPVFKKDQEVLGLSWMKEEELPLAFKRLNGENHYAKPIAEQLKKAVEEILPKNLAEISSERIADNSGYTIRFASSLDELLVSKDFFGKFLKPLSDYLNNYFIKLAEIFVDCNCYKIDQILQKTSSITLSDDDIETLRSLPPMRDEKTIQESLKKEGFTTEAIFELIAIVKNRYLDGVKQDAWRKGFAYALVFEDLIDKNDKRCTELKITPGAYLGSAGVVEAKGVVLKRPENAMLPNDLLIEKSRDLYKLADVLSNR